MKTYYGYLLDDQSIFTYEENWISSVKGFISS